jgi:hypothetical protein
MSVGGHRIELVLAMVAMLSCSSCSLLFTTKPPPSAANLPPMASVGCTSSIVAPIFDTIGAATFTSFSVNRLLVDPDRAPPLVSVGADVAIAASAAVAYGISAAYGYKVTRGCAKLKRGHASAPTNPGAFPAVDEESRRQSRFRRRSPTPEPPPAVDATTWEAPLSLPKVIGGFAFSTTHAEAEKICAASGREWEMVGVHAHCFPKAEGDGENAELEFDPNRITKIALVHAPDEDAFNRSYDALHAKLKARYGKPQVWRTTPTGNCATALPECLRRGESFTGSKWVLPLGSVELAPVWRDGEALIEERYAVEPAPTN